MRRPGALSQALPPDSQSERGGSPAEGREGGWAAQAFPRDPAEPAPYPGFAGTSPTLAQARESGGRPGSYRFASSPCGGVHVEVAGARTLLRHSGALWLAADRALVFADVHLEKGSAYAARGQMLPPYDTRETLRRIALEVEALAPRLLIMLGDALHDVEAEARMAREDIEALFAIARGRTLVWVVGNHDPLPPANLPGEPAEEMALCGLILRHEPTPGSPIGEVAGHLHPCARVVAKGRGSVRRRCFVTDGERLILPAFGAYAGGLSIRDQAFAGLFRRAPLAVALGAKRAHAIGWASVRGD